MSDTPAQPSLLEAALPPSAYLSLDGDAVDKLARLGAEANGVQFAILEDVGSRTGQPRSVPVALIRGDNPKVISVKALVEEWRTTPAFAEGTAKTLTLESFIELVNRHKNQATVTFADSNWRAPSLTAVIDYHPEADGGEIAADNGKHRVHYAFPLSEEWKAWIDGDGKAMEQIDFAAMIEDRIADLTAPLDATKIWMERDFQTTIATPAQLITLSRGLAVNVEAKVKDFKTLQSGAGQVVFEETHTGADGQPINVPGLFVLNIAPFFMGEKIEIPVRLRYRVRQGKIVWFYQIYRPDASITEAVRHAIFDVRSGTELPVYEGAPEMSATGAPVR